MFSTPSFHAESNGSTPVAVSALVRPLTPPLRYKHGTFTAKAAQPDLAVPPTGFPVPRYPMMYSSGAHIPLGSGDFEFPIKSAHQRSFVGKYFGVKKKKNPFYLSPTHNPYHSRSHFSRGNTWYRWKCRTGPRSTATAPARREVSPIPLESAPVST